MCRESEFSRDALGGAGSVFEGVIGREDELVAEGEGVVGEGFGFPDGVAGGVAEPLFVGDAGVAEVVYFFGGVVRVDVD